MTLTCNENRNLPKWQNAQNLQNYPLSNLESKSEKFDWGEFLRGQVLGAHSFGYLTTQIIGKQSRFKENF